MSFNSQSSQDYNHSGSGQYVQQQQLHRKPSASSAGSGVSAAPETSSAQLYMGDLDPNWTENDIKQIWAAFGEPNIHIKLIKNNGSMTNSGYCFVEFPSNLAATNALLKTGLSIPLDPSRTLKLNWASFATMAGTEFAIFVGDLAPNVTESQLFGLFISRYTSTVNAKIVFDQTTGVSKGYGFVKFGNEAEQQRSLLEMQGVFLNGRAIRVSTTSKNKPKFQSMGSGTIGASSGAPTGAPTGHAQCNNQALLQQSQFIYPVQQQPALSQFTDPNNTTVFIGGLSSLVTEEELRTYFQPFGQIVYVKIPVGKGCGFVQYVDRGSAENAIAKMQGFPIGNSRIRLSWGRSAKQVAAMQQAFAIALEQQRTQQHHPRVQLQQHTQQQGHQHGQQHSQQHGQQSQQAQQGEQSLHVHPQSHQGQQQTVNSMPPLLQQQLHQQFPYQPQPGMPKIYNYALDSLTSTGSNYVPMCHTNNQLPYQSPAIPDASSAVLYPNRSSLDYSGFSTTTSNKSSFSFSPPASLGATYQGSDYYNVVGTPMVQTPNTAASGQSNIHPQVIVQGSETYEKGRNSSIDRLEQGSNGYIFV
ncbi:HCL381Wp [Eremothecium sinecaudum]|uniref:HCL381Wp n=1 Tax=Eremothecium sinecaudum TaxID=45286 RepID=A0A120K1U9_9SACH|nr:HCL381Wp [Eremothecium sinecaudum]AMD19770.1 HCL381Wp [Eremothecium sinecaudum]